VPVIPFKGSEYLNPIPVAAWRPLVPFDDVRRAGRSAVHGAIPVAARRPLLPGVVPERLQRHAIDW